MFVSNPITYQALVPPITRSDVKFPIEQLNKKKIPGPDNIVNDFLRNTGNCCYHNWLISLINTVLTSNKIPLDQQTAAVLSLYKIGDKANLKYFPPISLMNSTLTCS